MKKIGLFLSAAPQAGGMFQYTLAMLSALRALPANEYSLVIAYASPGWRERVRASNADSFPVTPARLLTLLAVVPSFLPGAYERWGHLVTRFSGWADDLLKQACNLWVFPRQEVWSALFPTPVLAAVHDLMHRYQPHFPESSSYGRDRYRDAYLRALCGRANGILVDSEVGKRQIQESYGTASERLFVLPYIPPAYLWNMNEDADFDNKYRLPKKFVFYAAQFWEHKNHIRLIRAIAEVRKDVPDICLVLVGSEQNGKGKARREVEELGLQRQVRFAGYVPERDMAGFYRRARSLIFPTLFGPTNIPPLEAFALGCPVAVSEIYGAREQVGDAGVLFDPYSVESMAAAIRQLWVDDALCLELSRQGRQKAAAWGPAQFESAVHQIIERLTS